VAFSFGIATLLGGVNRQTRDPWLCAAQSIPLNIAEGNGKQSLRDKSTTCCVFAMPLTTNRTVVENRT
jgi:hypothetical protein